jgi:hypothetical protein
VLVPEGELSSDWREALTAIAHWWRNAFLRHAWALEGLRGARIGPNGVRHFEQTFVAVSGLDLDLVEKIALVSTVDDYVFGFLVRSGLWNDSGDLRQAVVPYLATMLESGDYPEISRLFEGQDPADAFDLTMRAVRSEDRLERGLDQLMDGLQAWLEKR